MKPTPSDLETLARGAGAILRAGYEQDHQVQFKGVIDLVTEVDHRSEAYLLEEIRRRFPGHAILAEESGGAPGAQTDQWYVDPLDGTVNYAHGVPFFCVSIAYARAGQVVLAAVYDPMRDELFTAARGEGSWLNGRRLHASTVSDLRQALLVTGFPYDTWTTAENNLENFARFSLLSQGVRRLGSAALDLCYVAAGRLDGYWELSLKPWDVAAGGLIASEAGAFVTNLRGTADYLSPPQSILAASPGLHARMLELLKKPE